MTQMVGAVGIIANPASGKDIRRLVAHGSTFDNNEKINIVRRVLKALESLGVEDVSFMPDTYGIVVRAQQQAKTGLSLHPLPMMMLGNASDSQEAAQRMRDLGTACIVTLGGDGTNRVVAKGCGDVPLVPISTGTNNVFPRMIESTLAGLAAATVARGHADRAIERRPRLDIVIDGVPADAALVDVVLSSQPWIGSRAIWRTDHMHEVVLAHIPAAAIGVSSLGPLLLPGSRGGAHILIGGSERSVLAPLAPGQISAVPIRSVRVLAPGELVTLERRSGTIALDGEREIELTGAERADVVLSPAGPRVVDCERAVRAGIAAGLFDLERT